MRAAEELARERGCDRLEVTSSRDRAEAHAFYVALGYEEQSERQGGQRLALRGQVLLVGDTRA